MISRGKPMTGRKRAPMTFLPSQISLEVTWDWTRVSAVTNQCLAVRVIHCHVFCIQKIAAKMWNKIPPRPRNVCYCDHFAFYWSMKQKLKTNAMKCTHSITILVRLPETKIWPLWMTSVASDMSRVNDKCVGRMSGWVMMSSRTIPNIVAQLVRDSPGNHGNQSSLRWSSG
jgi:hypothetical protein